MTRLKFCSSILFAFLMGVSACQLPGDNKGSSPKLKKDLLFIPKQVKVRAKVDFSEVDLDLVWSTILTNDTFVMPIEDGRIAFNYDFGWLLDESKIEMLQLIDMSHEKMILSWHPFLGRLSVSNPSKGKYFFEGSGNFPENGNWNENFVNHPIIRYVFEFERDKYRVYRDQSIELQLPWDESRLNQLKKYIFANPVCCDQHWDIAATCFDSIEVYEYQLFASLLSGQKKNLNSYLNLRKDITITNAGEFSEYLEGNYQLLMLYGIITPDDYNSDFLTYFFEYEFVPYYFPLKSLD